ncbi:sensor domain-containing diguanylate cyclase [Vibrio taketomensis]|uniref:sensor domain-containing diguanylate cyclase n=1 Tax=Vibrio taketomensis TaxID=2572923 RepID=UPI0013899C7F|nr:diguanylate cyclase [Vibrio taketomensis]
MELGRRWDRTLVLLFIPFIFLALVCIEYTHLLHHQYVARNDQDNAREELALIRSKIESLVISDISLAKSIPMIVASNPQLSQSQWEDVAKSISERSKHISAMLLAPDNVITYVYPVKQFSDLIGVDYQQHSEHWPVVKHAMATKDVVLEDSMPLQKGDPGIVARIPIFLDPPFYQRYWGVASVVISLQNLLADAGVSEFEEHYDIAIAVMENEEQVGNLLYGEHNTQQNAFTNEVISFSHGQWLLSASTENGYASDADWYQRNSVRLIGYSALILVILAFFAVFRLYRTANQLSLHDDLTGLPNRRYFIFTLQRHLTIAKNSSGKEYFALVNIDLDKFKQINDKYGHDAGDRVLRAVGERIQNALRASDVVARVGGDEFLVLVPRMREEQHIQSIVRNIRSALIEPPIEYNQVLISIRASFGYAIYSREMSSVEAIMKAADSAMYKQKFNDLEK